jgi:hypothetical protein
VAHARPRVAQIGKNRAPGAVFVRDASGTDRSMCMCEFQRESGPGAEAARLRAIMAARDVRWRWPRSVEQAGNPFRAVRGPLTLEAGGAEGGRFQAEPSRQSASDLVRSGTRWHSIADARGWSNSTAFSSLDPSWGTRARGFVELLRASGAAVDVSAGRRHPSRAFLMHYAWGVAHGQYTPAQANDASRAHGIPIDWDHGDATTSRAAALAQADAFQMVTQAVLDSSHIRGLAIDVTISNLPASITIDGRTHAMARGASGRTADSSVAAIGRAMGVIWGGPGDDVHWSHNGH